jgi:hypothetical protein
VGSKRRLSSFHVRKIILLGKSSSYEKLLYWSVMSDTRRCHTARELRKQVKKWHPSGQSSDRNRVRIGIYPTTRSGPSFSVIRRCIFPPDAHNGLVQSLHSDKDQSQSKHIETSPFMDDG